MDEVQKYWRDKVMGLFQWGITIYLLILGWSLTYHDKFEFCRDPMKTFAENRDNRVRAWSLFVGSIVFGVALPLVIHLIYKNYLSERTDDTVLPKWILLTASIVVSFLLITVSFLTGYLYGC
jgi:amino acid permease